MKTASQFRMWVYNTYYENSLEREAYGDECINAKRYFQMYRWWLKREFQYQKKQNNL